MHLVGCLYRCTKPMHGHTNVNPLVVFDSTPKPYLLSAFHNSANGVLLYMWLIFRHCPPPCAENSQSFAEKKNCLRLEMERSYQSRSCSWYRGASEGGDLLGCSSPTPKKSQLKNTDFFRHDDIKSFT